ncbi:MAG: LysM peptidoglycan-binding domain-containing protein [Planctomycetes bacterium]|nr:LysM peptidoglycan-binding domain-containing protein [Planctomycetota bacterium]
MQRDIKLGLVVGLVLLVLCGFFYMKMRATGTEPEQATGTGLEGILETPQPGVAPSALETKLPKIVKETPSTEPDLGEFAAREKPPVKETPAPAMETETPAIEPEPNTVVTLQPAAKTEDDKTEEAVKEDVQKPAPALPHIPSFPVRQTGEKGAAARSPFATPGEREYEVQPGDTLSGIASEELGSVKYWKEIFEANKDRLSAPEKLVVGMRLILPDITAEEEKPTPAPEPALVPPKIEEKAGEMKDETQEGEVHVVKKGETLSDIAGEYLGNKNKWKLIAKANPSVDPDRIRPGMKLRIPRGE